MSKIKELLTKLKDRAIAALQEAWYTEPTVITTAIVAAVIAGGGAFGIVIPKQTVEVIVPLVIPILLGGLVVRRAVTSPRSLAALSRRRVVSHHRLRRRARARLEQLRDYQGDAALNPRSAGSDKLRALEITPATRLTVPDKRIGGWWVVEVVG